MSPPRAPTASWLDSVPDARVVAGTPAAITAVCHDSRRVVPGALFVAVPGFDVDGHDYIAAALARGATTILIQRDHEATWGSVSAEGTFAIVSVPDTRRVLAQAAAAFYGHPAKKLGVIGVTGTDGKTTTVHLIAHVLESAGRPAGYMSSVYFRSGPVLEPNASHMTTLESPEVQRMLAGMVDTGMRYAVIEASSHGLALHRVDECDFDVAVFTTLSSDHLDFHKTLEEYRAAKGRLFQMLDESPAKDGVAKTAVLNADDETSAHYRTLTRAPIVTYGIDASADVRAENIASDGWSTRFRLVASGSAIDVAVPLAGLYNVHNCLAAAATALSQGIALDEIAHALESFPGIPGRLQRVDAGQPFEVVIDIASTPEALRRVLETLRPLTKGKLIAVFGAAGERDPGRRDGMGRVAGELADFAVLTNEDPRREDADAIIEAIASGLRQAGRTEGDGFVRVPDRREALRYAFERAQPGDTVLLAGKANEPSIVIGTEHHPWDETAVATELLKEL
jgi:UDP-N-acetylmuramoyl-L-alanyl-D-glutamate--2,6-diaminopimelate ligase